MCNAILKAIDAKYLPPPPLFLQSAKLLWYIYNMIKQTPEGIIANIRISPNAKKNEIINDGEIVKVKITAQPIDGKANKALVEFLSKNFKIPKTSIKILKGETSKDKTVLFMTDDEEKINNVKNSLQ